MDKTAIAEIIQDSLKGTIKQLETFKIYLKDKASVNQYSEDLYTGLFSQALRDSLSKNPNIEESIVLNQFQVYNIDDRQEGIADIVVFYKFLGESYELIIEAKHWPEKAEEWTLEKEADKNKLEMVFNEYPKQTSVMDQLKTYFNADDPYRSDIGADNRMGAIVIYENINPSINVDRYFNPLKKINSAIFYATDKNKCICLYGEVFSFEQLQNKSTNLYKQSEYTKEDKVKINHKFDKYKPNDNIETLILGTFNPDFEGNEAEFFYGRGRNYLWKILPLVFGDDSLKTESAERKLAFITDKRIGFADLIKSCYVDIGQEINYYDGYIDGCDIEWNDIVELISRYKNIKRVCFTRKTFGDIPNIKSKVQAIQAFCESKSIIFTSLPTPARYWNEEKQSIWNDFFNS